MQFLGRMWDGGCPGPTPRPSALAEHWLELALIEGRPRFERLLRSHG